MTTPLKNRLDSNSRAAGSPLSKRIVATKCFFAAAIALGACNQVRGQEATFSFNVPPEATLYVDNQPTTAKSTGASGMRQFRTPSLPKGQWLFYDFRVVFYRGDREFSEKHRIYFVAGAHIKRSFMNMLNDADFKTYPRQFQIPAEMRVHDLRKLEEIRSFLEREKSKRVLGSLLAVDAARLDDRDKILTAVTEMDPIDIHPGPFPT